MNVERCTAGGRGGDLRTAKLVDQPARTNEPMTDDWSRVRLTDGDRCAGQASPTYTMAGKLSNAETKALHRQEKKERKSEDPVALDREGEIKNKDKKKHRREPELVVKPAFTLLANDKTVLPALSSLFAAQPTPVIPRQQAERPVLSTNDEESDGLSSADEDELNALDDSDDDVASKVVADVGKAQKDLTHENGDRPVTARDRKRKRKAEEEGIEDAYMARLAREQEQDAEAAAAERAQKRQKLPEEDIDVSEAESGDDESVVQVDSDENVMSPPPQHETQQVADLELSKANRTVFLGNVSTSAISSKTARKSLITHLGSFFTSLKSLKDGEAKHKIESIRFRSTPYASALPKKAAYAKRELMDATTKSTNAYVVYASPLLAREAVKHLNGTMVLDRHLRVDEVAHPAKVDNKRCIFVGNLGFVDDESNIQDANEEEGREKRKRGKEPSDIEEGLWRTFGKCGKVESVRVIRDSVTRVGKGIAYVQFEDENTVEAALLLNEKKFPPMLPRKLRIARAKAQKKNAKPGSGRPSVRPQANHGGYQRKITGAELSQMGRAGKLFGRAAAAQVKKGDRLPASSGANGERLGPRSGALRVEGSSNTIRKPEDFVFEGHRASIKSGKSGLKLGKPGKKVGKPTNRSAKRGAAFKAGGRKKART
nr:nucleolar protein 12 [Quercus suber]